MSDNALKKEFNKRDVQRLRNLVNKKYGEATGIQTGYTKKVEEHKEGDIWEENNKTWTIKNGLKQNVTKMDTFKKLAAMPILCPSCHNPMKTIYDKKMYFIHNMCLNCVSEMETKLKREGKYNEYASKIIMGNINNYVVDYEAFLNDISGNIVNNGFVTEDGVIEKWVGGNMDVLNDIKKKLAAIKESIDPK